MKKFLKIAVAVIIVLALAAYACWHFYPLQMLAFIDRATNPIADTKPVNWAQGPATRTTPADKQPNIILIVADDLGINDLTATGKGVAGQVPTPHIDSIGHDGAMFDTGYAANATCSPSRASMMTGRSPQRFGFEFTSVPSLFAKMVGAHEPGAPHQPIYHAEYEDIMPPLADQGIPPEQITIAELLKGQGYHTMHIGKWHLGESAKMRPEAQGFDESLGFMSGASKFGQDDDPKLVSAKLDYDPIDRFLWGFGSDAVQWNGSQRFHVGEYMTDYFSKQAVAAIDANKNRPFFMYLAYNAPHTPFQALKSDYDALSGIKDHKTRVYGAMIRALDRGVGQVLGALEKNNIARDTLVIFVSDNGGAWYAGLNDINAPYRGWKATFFEGGIRTPYFIRWPARIAAGRHASVAAAHHDIFATAAAAAGAALPTDRTLDGIDLIPFAAGTGGATPERTIFWRSGSYRAVRQGDWKLQVADKPGRTWLFNLASDPTERNDFSKAEPQRVAALKALLAARDKELPKKPLWPALIEAPVRIDVPSNAKWTPEQEYIYWSN